MRGNWPSCTACWVIEKTPVITDWLAMMAASVASITMGRCAQCGMTEKKAMEASPGLRSKAAPWPK